MAKGLERRIARLEGVVPRSAEVERANRIVIAFHRVRYEPELATAEDQALVSTTTNSEWQIAFAAAIKAAGGLEAAVEASYKPNSAREVAIDSSDLQTI